MNKLILIILSVLIFPTVALAEITPNDVVEKMKSGDTKTAEMLTRQILKDHPDSAKAHYYLGQILGTEGDYKAAYAELKKAAQLDKSLSFAASPDKFREQMNKVEVNTGRADAPKMSDQKEGGSGWGKWLILFGLAGLTYWYVQSRPKKPEPDSERKYTPNPMPSSGSGIYTRTASPRPASPSPAPAPRPASYHPGANHPSYVSPAPHVVNNYNSGGDGLVTGLVLGEMLSDRGTNTVIERDRVIERDTTNNTVAQPNDFDSGSSPSAPDNDFDAGKDNKSSFDAGSSDMDSGSSSSFDSGSDSGSSFDSGGGSDSSGGDW